LFEQVNGDKGTDEVGAREGCEDAALVNSMSSIDPLSRTERIHENPESQRRHGTDQHATRAQPDHRSQSAANWSQ